MSKSSRIRKLLQEGQLNRAQVARATNASYQMVRNVETMWLGGFTTIEPSPEESQGPSKDEDFALCQFRYEPALYEETDLTTRR